MSFKKTTQTEKAAPPVAKFRSGGVSLSVWEKTSDDGETSYSLTVQKSFRDKDGKWVNTDFLRVSDLPHLAAAAQRAHNKILDNYEEEGGEE